MRLILFYDLIPDIFMSFRKICLCVSQSIQMIREFLTHYLKMSMHLWLKGEIL